MRVLTATHCNTLQHTATHCNTLQHTATHFSLMREMRISLLRNLYDSHERVVDVGKPCFSGVKNFSGVGSLSCELPLERDKAMYG